MTNIFKTIGKGFLYVLLFPVIIIGVTVYGVFGLAVFIFQFFKSIVLYFSGRSLTSDLDEDLAAKAILGKLDPEDDEEEEEKPLSLYPSDTVVYGSGYVSPLVEDKKPEKEIEIKEGEDDEL